MVHVFESAMVEIYEAEFVREGGGGELCGFEGIVHRSRRETREHCVKFCIIDVCTDGGPHWCNDTESLH